MGLGAQLTPTLVVNPSTDAVFGAFAELIVDHGVASPTDLERRLRPIYPAAVVHPRLLAAEQILIWYVYRDGHWIRSRREAETSGEYERDARFRRGPAIDSRGDPARRGAGAGARAAEG